MYDPKFENAVQRKMEELEFRPSESVWVNIEKVVAERRRRRVIPFFWRLLIPAMLVTAVGGAYYFGKQAGKKAALPAQAMGTTAGVKDAEMPGQAVGTPAGVKGAEGDVTTRAPEMPVGVKEADAPAGVKKAKMPAGVEDAKHVAGAVWRKGGGKTVVGKSTASVGESGIGAGVSGEADRETEMERDLYRPGLANQRIAYRVSASAARSEKGLVNLSTLARVRRPWEAGFVAGAGIGRLNQLDASPSGNPAYGMAQQPFYPQNSASVGKNYSSEVRQGASFYAGIYLQKPVSDRWVFHTGLDLHYYSSNVSVGQQVSATPPSSATLLNPTTFAAAAVTPVYTVGDRQTYTNRYYILELPVSMQYRLNRSRLLPLFLEGGGVVSRLMGASAIFYNPTTGLYVKDENVLNKTRIDVSSALLAGLPFHGVRIQVGPEVQYALTPLSNAQGLGSQHFFYTGIRLVVLPGRR